MSIQIQPLAEVPVMETAFYALQQEYLPDTDTEICRAHFARYSKAYLICREGEDLIGITYGWPRAETDPADPSFTLQGICIRSIYAAQGLGSRLLRHVEEQVRLMGFPAISVGSAPGYVEHFYMKNGWQPVCVKQFDDLGTCRVIPANTPQMLAAVKRTDGDFAVFEKVF